MDNSSSVVNTSKRTPVELIKSSPQCNKSVNSSAPGSRVLLEIVAGMPSFAMATGFKFTLTNWLLIQKGCHSVDSGTKAPSAVCRRRWFDNRRTAAHISIDAPTRNTDRNWSAQHLPAGRPSGTDRHETGPAHSTAIHYANCYLLGKGYSEESFCLSRWHTDDRRLKDNGVVAVVEGGGCRSVWVLLSIINCDGLIRDWRQI